MEELSGGIVQLVHVYVQFPGVVVDVLEHGLWCGKVKFLDLVSGRIGKEVVADGTSNV